MIVITNEKILILHKIYWVDEKADGPGGNDKMNDGTLDIFFLINNIKQINSKDTLTEGILIY